MKSELCPGCTHPYHDPGTECPYRIEHDGQRHWHLCLCHNQPNARKACPPQMTCQGGRYDYSDIWNLQRGRSLRGANGEIITPDVLTEPTEQEQRQTIQRLGLMVDEYSAGASALADKLRRARDTHREVCPIARGVLSAPAFRCSMCDVLDAPAIAVLPEQTDRGALLLRAADFVGGLLLTRTSITAAELEAELRRVAAEEQPAECTASISRSCLAEGQSETACDTEAGECVYGGRPAAEEQPAEPWDVPDARPGTTDHTLTHRQRPAVGEQPDPA